MKRLFSNEEVEDARRDFERGASIKYLQSKFAVTRSIHVSYTTIEQMVYGVTYRDAPGPLRVLPDYAPPSKKARLTPKMVDGRRGPKSRLTDTQVSEVRRRSRYEWESTNELAEEFGVAPAIISNIKVGRTGKLVPETPAEVASRLEFEKKSEMLEKLRRSFLPP